MPDFTPGHFSFETRKLIDDALTVAPNAMWTYGRMAEVIGQAVDGSSVTVQTAVKRLARDHGVEFKNVRNIGYLRLDETGIVEMGPVDRQAIRSRVKRAVQRTGNIKNWESLSEHYKREVDSHRSLIALMRHLLKPSAIKAIRNEVDKVHDKIDVDRTLSLFRPKPKE